MKPAARWARRGTIAVGVVLVVVLMIRAWVVPGLIARELRSRFRGPATFDGWWLGFRSGGVAGLSLREGDDPKALPWLTAERVETDLSLGGFLRGRFAPTTITVEGPKLTLRFDRKGGLLTKGPFAGAPAPSSPPPDVEIRDGAVTIEQEGRPPMLVRGVSGKLVREGGGEELSLASDDPDWGRWSVRGHFDPNFKAGRVALKSGPGFSSRPDLTSRLPFVPPEVWANFDPTGPLDVALTAELGAGFPGLRLTTELGLREVVARLPTLGITTEATSGRLVIEDGVLRSDGLTGRSLSGSITAKGTMDFRPPTPRFDLELGLDRIDVARTPPAWQLAEIGASGRLSGMAHLLVALPPEGPDLTGSTGEADIDGAVLQGIPIKSLHIAMQAEGTDLRYDAKPVDGHASGLVPGTFLARLLVGLQAPAAPRPPPPRFRLPQSITTRIELEDVDLTTVLARLEVATRIKAPVPLAGKLSLKATATIPLGHLTDLKDYSIRGLATLRGASIAGVDLGRLTTRFALEKGVLDLDELDGHLVERPNGSAESPPPATPPPSPGRPLEPGEFRGSLHAELSPPGRLTAHFDARDLPVGEIVAPFFPRPTPVGGLLSTTVDATSDVAHLADPDAWSVRGRVESQSLRYQSATLDAISTVFTIDRASLSLPDLSARLAGNPLSAKLLIGLTGPRSVSGEVDVRGWSIERVLALFPRAPSPSPVSGIVDGHVRFGGTVSPPTMKSEGTLLVHAAAIRSVPLGDVSATWSEEGDEVVARRIEAHPFSGRLTARATFPTAAGRPARVEASFAGVHTDELADAVMGGEFKLSGAADGRLTATIPADPKGLRVDMTLEAPRLVIQGVPAGKVTAAIRGQDGSLAYEVAADGPDGRARFKGTIPLGGPTGDDAANAELRAVDFSLADIERLLGIKGAPPQLKARAAIDANLRLRKSDPRALGLHGIIETRDIRWGDAYPIGQIRGVVSRTADSWRVDQIRGEVVGGVASGVFWGETPAEGPRPVQFEVTTERAPLSRLLAFAPGLGDRAEGFATLRVSGRMEEALTGRAEVAMTTARLAGLPLADLRLPAEFTFHPTDGSAIVQARQWSVRVAGGRVIGSTTVRLGLERSFALDMSLTDMDVESLLRLESNAGRPGAGKLNGRLVLGGHDPGQPRTYRGRLDLSLHDAAIGDIPVIRELGRFLGNAQGGAFEAGQLRGTIANGLLLVDDLRLDGRILQVHATGTVSFGGAIDLSVLVNTNQIIPQTGEALASIIPGLRQAVGRDEEARLRVANYLSNRLLKFRVGGTVRNPNVSLDRGVVVGEAAVGFFSGVLKLPLGLVK